MNTFSHPKKIIDQLPIFPGQTIADFGAGSGAYTMILAEKTASSPQSVIYAVDINKDLVARIAQEAETRKLTNITAVWGDVDDLGGSRLRDQSVNVVLVANTLFQVENRQQLIQEVRRVLAKDGTLILIDWTDSFGNIGPHKDEIINEANAILLLEEQGFSIERGFDAGGHHYGLIAKVISSPEK
jgi:ubiquinone/menaquinone biosynthesis C-methylase UbiE